MMHDETRTPRPSWGVRDQGKEGTGVVPQAHQLGASSTGTQCQTKSNVPRSSTRLEPGSRWRNCGLACGGLLGMKRNGVGLADSGNTCLPNVKTTQTPRPAAALRQRGQGNCGT